MPSNFDGHFNLNNGVFNTLVSLTKSQKAPILNLNIFDHFNMVKKKSIILNVYLSDNMDSISKPIDIQKLT